MFQRMDFRVFCHATESEEKVRKALTFVSRSDVVKTRKARGIHGNPIIIMESGISGRRLRSFMEDLKSSGLIKNLGKGIKNRMTDDCCMYLRFDKQKAFNGELKIVDHDDVIASKLKLRSDPKEKASSLIAVGEYFEV
jgi:RNA binding exosome subunit